MRNLTTHALLTLIAAGALGACASGGAHEASAPAPKAAAASEAPTAGGAFDEGAAMAEEEKADSEDDATESASDEPAPPPGAPAIAARKKGKRASRSPARRAPLAIAASGVKAGEWDDNANYREFQRFLSTQDGVAFRPLDISKRRFIAVRDRLGKGVPGCKVSVSDAQQHTVTLTTTTSGRTILFPVAEGLQGSTLTASTNCSGSLASKKFDLQSDDGLVDLQLKQNRRLSKRRTIDIAFVLDTTGSMSEEIAAVKQTIRKVASDLDGGDIDVRIGLVEFKDRTDSFLTKVHPFSRDLKGFSKRVSGIRAAGGGDMPEDVNEGLNVALKRLSWSDQSVGRFAFLIGDAPPHLDYQQRNVHYTQSAKSAAHQGIQVFTIAASGMDTLGQIVWRQTAQYTGGTNMFVLRGGAGPQSAGAGDAKSSCGGTHKNYASGNLDALIVAKVRRELKALDGNPLRIAGLGMDENAKPCHERLVLAQ